MKLNIHVCALALAVFPALSYADTHKEKKIVADITVEEFSAVLEANTTAYLSKILRNPDMREDYIRQYYAFHNLEQRAEELSPLEKELVNAELALRRSEILRDAVIKHELDKQSTDIEALAKERYLVKKDQYKTRRRIKIAQIFIAKKPGQDEAIRQKMESLLAQLEEDNLRRAEQVENQDSSDDPDASSEEDNVDLFAELAKEHSESAYAELGGLDPRWIVQPPAQKEINDPVIEAAFNLLRVGEISDVIEGTKGYHILRLMNYVPNRQQSFEEVKEDIISNIKKELWSAKEKTLNRSLAAPDDLEFNDDLATEIIEQTYKLRDESLK